MSQVVWVHAARCGLDNSQNVYFYGNLGAASKFGKKGVIAIAGDVNGHIEGSAEIYEDQHRGYEFGVWNKR